MSCPSATYKTKDEAKEVRQRLRRHYRPTITIRQCEKCDNYHLRADATKLQISKQGLVVIRHTALGYTLEEISKITGIKYNTALWYIQELKYAFSALSLPHLVSILIALGVLDPREFVSELTERCEPHGRPGNDRRNPVQRNGTASVLQSA